MGSDETAVTKGQGTDILARLEAVKASFRWTDGS
jgi:hypothetical protein